MQLRSDSFDNHQPIPEQFAFGKRADPFALSDNRSPHLAWRDAPAATRSFVLTCIDNDVPSKRDDVNQEGKTVPKDLPRVEFVHWLMANIPAECGELAEGACCDGVTPRGKRDPAGPPGSVQGENSFTELVRRRRGHVRHLPGLRRPVPAVERCAGASLPLSCQRAGRGKFATGTGVFDRAAAPGDAGPRAGRSDCRRQLQSESRRLALSRP